jgi:hypothetical protein
MADEEVQIALANQSIQAYNKGGWETIFLTLEVPTLPIVSRAGYEIATL